MTQQTAEVDLVARVRRDLERSRLRARNGLKLLGGTSPARVGMTPRDVVWQSGKVELRRYRSEARTLHPPVLLVHSLVSRSYVLDLSPGNSFVEQLLARGFDVFLLDWGEPDELEASYDLSTYCDDLLPQAVRQTAAAAGTGSVMIFGYCFGGLLSLLYLAGHASDPVSALAVMATPVNFDEMRAMGALLQDGRLDAASLVDRTGNVPPEVIRNSFRVLQPTGDILSYVNLWQHLWNDDYVAAHQAMAGWGNDHIPFPGAAFVEMADVFIVRDLLRTGSVPIGGREVHLRDITVPFVSIVGAKDHIVPPAAAAGLCDLVGSSETEEISLAAGHAGLVVGRTAQTRNIPAMANWLEAHAEAR